MNDHQVKEFTEHTRRALYLKQILVHTLNSIYELPLPTGNPIKPNIKIILSALKRYEDDMIMKCKGNRLKAVEDDLGSDRLHDLSLIIDSLNSVSNLSDVLNLLEQSILQTKEEQAKKLLKHDTVYGC